MEFMLDSCLSVCQCWHWTSLQMNRELNEPLLFSQQSGSSYTNSSLSTESLLAECDQESLETLSNWVTSGDKTLQLQAAKTLHQLSQKAAASFSQSWLDLLILLLQVDDPDVQKLGVFSVTNLLNAINYSKCLTMDKSGLLAVLIKLLISQDIQVQSNVLSCVTVLTGSPLQKMELVSYGAVKWLLTLAQSSNNDVQNKALGVLLNLSLLEAACDEMAIEGAIPVLTQCLNSPDSDGQFYAVAAIANMATLTKFRNLFLSYGSYDTIKILVGLLFKDVVKVKCQASFALRNLSTEEAVQVLVVQLGALIAFEEMLVKENTAVAALACLHNLSIARVNESFITKPDLLNKILQHLHSSNNDVQHHVASIIRNLATGQYIQSLVNSHCSVGLVNLLTDDNTSELVQIEVTASLAYLTKHEKAKSFMLSFNNNTALYAILKLGLVCCHLPQLQYHCACILSNLVISDLPQDVLMSAYLMDFISLLLTSSDNKFKHIALWSLLHLLKDDQFANQFSSRFHIKSLEDLTSSTNKTLKELSTSIIQKLESIKTKEFYPRKL